MQQRVGTSAATTASAAPVQHRFHELREFLATQLSKPVSLAIDARARNEFFTHYVTRDSASYDMLGAIYSKSKCRDHLSVSVDAVSLAFMANKYNGQPHISKMATEAYISALHALGKAVADPETALADATVQSILLLDLYEKMVNRSALTEDSSRTHLTGALALIQQRGTGNVDTYVGRRLVERLYITTIVSCAAAGTRVPQQVQDLQHWLDPYFDATDIRWTMTKINIAAITFSADVRAGKISGPENVIPHARSIDAQLASLESSLAPRWKSKRTYISETPNSLVYGRYYDVYEDHGVVNIRNIIRTLRLHIHALMALFRDVAPALLDPNSSAVMDACARDIIASVPAFILPNERPVNTEPFSPVQMLECYTLLPPMYLASRLSRDSALSSWTFGIMDHMAEVGGMKMAKVTVDTLRSDKTVAYWDIYALLGGYAFAV